MEARKAVCPALLLTLLRESQNTSQHHSAALPRQHRDHGPALQPKQTNKQTNKHKHNEIDHFVGSESVDLYRIACLMSQKCLSSVARANNTLINQLKTSKRKTYENINFFNKDVIEELFT